MNIRKWITPLAALALVGGVILTGCTSDAQDTAIKKPESSETSSHKLPSKPSASEVTAEWVDSVSPDLTSFQNDLDLLSDDDGVTVKDCKTLNDDVVALNADPEFPSTTSALAHDNWNLALQSYQSGFESCIDGDLVGLATQMSNGNIYLGKFTDYVKGLSE